MNEQSRFITEESHEEIVKENEKEKHKELSNKRNCERQRAYYHRKKDLKKNGEKKKIVPKTNGEKKKIVPKTNAERQKEYRQRKKFYVDMKRRKLCGNEENVVQDKPIIQLFKRLITSDNKQNTVLTNAQIVDILAEEFGINLWNIHELEGEIYLTIMKKYLKDWPQWEDFDENMNSIKARNNKKVLDEMLQTSYVKLKAYLNATLERAKVLAKFTVDKLADVDKPSDSKGGNNKNDNIVLEIKCSRNQLNQIFFRRPNPVLNNSIFNGAEPEPTQIKLNTLPLEAILNWWDVKICIQKGSTIFYERLTTHQLSHTLVNKNLMPRYNPLKTLPQEIQISRISKSTPTYISKYIYTVETLMKENPSLIPLLKFVRKDIHLMPEKVLLRSSYRRYTNKYPYTRYLYTEVKNPDINSRKYDLQLEETVSPMYRLFLGAPSISNATIEVECTPCQRKFFGTELIEQLKVHFEERHADEPDWKCTNCGNFFPMATLASTWWTHKC